jgi:hypothetical protein
VQWLGLRPGRRLPFAAPRNAQEPWFEDEPPDYVDWRMFTWPNGPSRSLPLWLAALTPAGADTLELEAGLFAPLIAERATPPLPRRRDLLENQLAARLPRIVARTPGRQAPRAGIPGWSMAVALAVDLYGVRSDEAADALELRDDSSRDAKDGSRGGRLYAQRGRPLLSTIGAWPWSVAEAGRLPRRWYCRQDYASALARWHYQQWLAAEVANLRTIPFARQPNAAAAIDDAARKLARDMYRNAYRTLTQIAAAYIDEAEQSSTRAESGKPPG